MIDPDMTEEILNKAVYTFGFEKQYLMAVEEMAELTHAIMKSYRCGKMSMTASIIEEMADVQIMLRQMRMTFDEDDEEHYKFVFDLKIRWLQNKIEDDIEEVDGND